MFPNKQYEFFRTRFKDLTGLVSKNSAVASGFFKLSMLRGLQLGFGLVTTYFLAHGMSVEKYGEYQFILNVIGVLTVFTLTEFGNTLMQSIARGFYGSYRRLVPFGFMTSFIGSVFLLGFSYWHGYKIDKPEMGLCFIIAAALFPLSHGLTIWRGLKIGEERFTDYLKLETCGLMVAQVGMILAITFFEGRYVEVFLWFMLIPAIINAAIILKTLQESRVRNSEVEKHVVAHGVKASFYSSFSTLANYIDKILLSFFLSPAALAIFVAADRIPDILRSTIQDAATALAPRFAKTDIYSNKLDRFFKLFCLIYGIGLIVLGFTVLPYMLRLIYGQAYEEAVPYMQALIVSVAIGNLASLQFRYIRSKLDTKNFRTISIGSSLFRVAMSLILIPLYGMEGAVVSALLHRIGLSVLTNHIIKRDYQARAEEKA